MVRFTGQLIISMNSLVIVIFYKHRISADYSTAHKLEPCVIICCDFYEANVQIFQLNMINWCQIWDVDIDKG